MATSSITKNYILNRILLTIANLSSLIYNRKETGKITWLKGSKLLLNESLYILYILYAIT